MSLVGSLDLWVRFLVDEPQKRRLSGRARSDNGFEKPEDCGRDRVEMFGDQSGHVDNLSNCRAPCGVELVLMTQYKSRLVSFLYVR